MIKNRVLMRFCTICMLILVVTINILPTFADEVENNLNIIEFRELVVENNSSLKDLKKQRDDLADNIGIFNDNYAYIMIGGDKSSGSKVERKGSYYQYAYPNFVQMVSLNANLVAMDVQIQQIESSLILGADTILLNKKMIEEQLNLYDQMVETTDRIYDEMSKKATLGLISKVDLEEARLNLENTKYSRDQLKFSLKGIEYSLKSMARLDPKSTYNYSTPIYPEVNFEYGLFLEYYKSAKASSQQINASKIQMDALENEKKYLDLYEHVVLDSDLLDFKRRYEDEKYNLTKYEKSLYINLKSKLDEYNILKTNIKLANDQIKYDENYLKKLSQMESLGQIIETQKMQYEQQVFISKLNKLKLENDMVILSQKIDMLINYGVSL